MGKRLRGKCAQPGCPVITTATRCQQHRIESPTWHANNSRSERRRRAATVSMWIQEHGWICPGWQCDPHPSQDLTAAHSVAVALGGVHSPLTVLCRSCNSRQGINPSN